MAVEQRENGEFVIDSMAKAKEALALRDDMLAEIEEAGLLEIQNDITQLSRAVGKFMSGKGIEEIKDKKTSRRAVLVQRFNRKWITTRKELTEAEAPTCLQDILPKDVYMRITKRVVDPAALDEAVREGLVKEKDIADAYIEIPQQPFVQVYDLRGADDEE